MRRLGQRARGASLVELLVGMVIALMVLAVALQLVLIARARYVRMADDALIADRAQQALDLIGMAVRQAGWITDVPAMSLTRLWPAADTPLALMGKDNCNSPMAEPQLQCSSKRAIRNSDALLVRFAGRSRLPDDTIGDSAMLDCLGYPVAERVNGQDDPRTGRTGLYAGMALFYIDSGPGEEPQLMCKSPRRENTTALPRTRGMVRGIETLQLLYTLSATPAQPEITLPADLVPPAQWNRVRYVHAAIVVRGERVHATSGPLAPMPLFPPDIADRVPATQQDMRFAPTDPHRRRTSFSATFRVRNPLRCEVDAC